MNQSDKFTRAEAYYRNGYGIRWISDELGLSEKSLRLWLSPDKLTRQRELFPPAPKPKPVRRCSIAWMWMRLRWLALCAILHDNRHETDTYVEPVKSSLDWSFEDGTSWHDSMPCPNPTPAELAMMREEQPELFDYV